jgi:hypothetical protein
LRGHVLEDLVVIHFPFAFQNIEDCVRVEIPTVVAMRTIAAVM